MNLLNQTIEELKKYNLIIQSSRSIAIRKETDDVSNEIEQLENFMETCEFTKKNAGTINVPLAGAIPMLKSNIPFETIEYELQQANNYYNESLKAVGQAAKDEAVIYTIPGSGTATKIVIELNKEGYNQLESYYMVGDKLYIWDLEDEKFERMKEIIKTNI
jgi:hypothetical protein